MKKYILIIFTIFYFIPFISNIFAQPIGSVISYSGNLQSLEKNLDWLVCDGRSLLIADYTILFETIGWTYGYGRDTSFKRTTFSLPDYRGYFLRGVDQGSKKDKDAEFRRLSYDTLIIVGDKVGSIEYSDVEGHEHILQLKGTVPKDNPSSGQATENADVAYQVSYTQGIHKDLDDMLKNRSHEESRPINISVYWIIKSR